MPSSKKTFPTGILVVALVVLLLALLNPSFANFKSYYQGQAQSSVTKNASGGVGELFGTIAKGAAGLAADASYKRVNLFVASLYQSKASDGSVQHAYLGIAKLFLKLK